MFPKTPFLKKLIFNSVDFCQAEPMRVTPPPSLEELELNPFRCDLYFDDSPVCSFPVKTVRINHSAFILEEQVIAFKLFKFPMLETLEFNTQGLENSEARLSDDNIYIVNHSPRSFFSLRVCFPNLRTADCDWIASTPQLHSVQHLHIEICELSKN
ncbi:hypothetical protein TRICI_000435 [Trichomonascus ciferrii]|uniref:Uncharacterized protein n=1 Tax=Trichomonascus ciferrii TaxID=44093 RepID=A0A642VDE9_9ASCO|nr:hypothetical protein TRICI_000435 [Trichomonascus ciferrii]